MTGRWPWRAGEPERLPCGCLVYRTQHRGEVAFVIEPCSLTCAEWDKPARFAELGLVSGRREPDPCPQCGGRQWRPLSPGRSRTPRWECRGCGLQVSGPDRRAPQQARRGGRRWA